MAKTPGRPKRPRNTSKSKAHRPEVLPIGPALADLLNPAINRGESGVGSSTGLISGTFATGDAANGPYVVTVTASDGTYSSSVSLNWNASPITTVLPPVSTVGGSVTGSVPVVAFPLLGLNHPTAL